LNGCVRSVRLRIPNGSRVVDQSPNKSLQRTFDPPPIFAAAKTGAASNAAKLRRYILRDLQKMDIEC
jgi:hypothetical protein